MKLYHTEFDEFKVELERRNLHKCLANLQNGSIDVALVKEFYARLYTIEEQAPKQAPNDNEITKPGISTKAAPLAASKALSPK